MKNTTMRILAVMLLVCVLLSALPFATLAADYTYDPNALYKAFTDGNSKVNGGSVSNKYLPDYFQAKFNNGDAGTYFALLLEDIADGTYTANLTFNGKNTAGAKVYVVAKSEATDGIMSSSSKRNELLSSKTPVTYARLGDAETSGSVSLTLTFSGDADKDYYMIFSPILPDTQKNGFVRLGKVELTKGGSTPKPTEPKPTEPAPTTPATEPSTTPATEPSTTPATTPSTEPSTTPATTPSTTPATTPATNAPTTPADNAGADEAGFPVAAIVAIVVVVLGGAAAGVYFFLKKKKAA